MLQVTRSLLSSGVISSEETLASTQRVFNFFTRRMVKADSTFAKAMFACGLGLRENSIHAWQVNSVSVFNDAMSHAANTVHQEQRDDWSISSHRSLSFAGWHRRLHQIFSLGKHVSTHSNNIYVPTVEEVNAFLQEQEPRKPSCPTHGASLTLDAKQVEELQSFLEQKPTPDQARVSALVQEGRCVFLGGPAGTGKTSLLRFLHAHLRLNSHKNVALAAMTGVAARNLGVGASTLHSLLHLRVDRMKGCEEARMDYTRDIFGQTSKTLLQLLDVLMIDEASMLSGDLLRALDQAARAFRRAKNKPFGGLQVVLSGDPLQLGAVRVQTQLANVLLEDEFAKAFARVQLTSHLRQKDPVTREAFAELRRGLIAPALSERIFESGEEVDKDENVVHIFPRRDTALRFNQLKVSKLPGTPVQFAPQHGSLFLSSDWIPFVAHLTFAKGQTPEELQQALSAMATTSISEESSDSFSIFKVSPISFLVHGRSNVWSPVQFQTLCEAFAKSHSASPTLRFGEFDPSLVPPSLLQSLTNEAVSVSVSSSTELSLKIGARVMLTRNLYAPLHADATILSCIAVNGDLATVIDFQPLCTELLPHPARNLKALTRLPDRSVLQSLPILKRDEGGVMQLPPMPIVVGGTWTTHHISLEVFALPLQLGYGFTVHKVQGLTLDAPHVVVDFRESFTCPHLLYVACTRVRSLNQLYILGDVQSPKVDEAALKLDDSLEPL